MKKSITLRGFSAYRLWTQLPRIEVSHLPDVIMFGAGIALFYAVVTVGRSWFGPFTPTVEISRSLRALPAYAGYSLLRITIAYVLSLGFTLVYGYVAAYNPRAERFMLPLLDVLAVDPCVEFSSGRDAGHGGAVSGPAARCGTGGDPSDFYRASLEHGLQFLCVAEKHSERNAGGGGDLPVQLVATLHADGAAFFGDRAGVELDDVGGRGMVRADGMRNVCAGAERFSFARPWLLSANRSQRRGHELDLVGALPPWCW